MNYFQKTFEFLLQEQFLLGCIVATAVCCGIFYLYLTWYRTRTVFVSDVEYEDWLAVACDKKQSLHIRRKLLYEYSRHPRTTLDDLYELGYNFPDYKIEKDPEVAKIIEYAREQVLKKRSTAPIE